MLSNDSLRAAFPVAEHLTKRGVYLQAKDKTPLGELVVQSLQAQMFHESLPAADRPTDQPFSERLIAGAAMESAGVVPHDELQNHFVGLAAKAVEDLVGHARNVINPKINALHQAVMGDVKVHMESADLVDVQVQTYADVWSSPFLLELTDRFKNSYPSSEPLVACAECPPPALRTGSSQFDAEVAAAVAKLEEGHVATLWSRMTRQAATTKDLLEGASDLDTLIYLLLAMQMQAEVPAGVNLSGDAWNAAITSVVAELSRAVGAIIIRRERQANNKQLVLQSEEVSSRAIGKVVVNGDVYGGWINSGGSPEALLGGLSNNVRGYDEILANKDKFEGDWKQIHEIRQTQAQGHLDSSILQSLRSHAQTMIRESGSESSFDAAVAQGHLNEALSEVGNVTVESLWSACMKVVCRVFANGTDVCVLLETIDQVSKARPGLAVREAALLGVIDYVCVWMFSQVDVKTAPVLR